MRAAETYRGARREFCRALGIDWRSLPRKLTGAYRLKDKKTKEPIVFLGLCEVTIPPEVRARALG